MMAERLSKSTKTIIIFAAIFLVSALLSYLLLGRSGGRSAQPPAASTNQSANATAQNQPSQTSESNESFLSIFTGANEPAQGTGQDANRAEGFGNVSLKLLLAALLTSVLAFRPRKFAIFFKRNMFVAQTQILLSVVAASLMMIVGDSAARAFGIFAAVSLVRFRTNIRDPKEITVLLASLAVGLASGVGRWDLAVILSLFMLALLWTLEFREPELVFRTMELKVKTRNLFETHEVVRRVLIKHKFGYELRALNREDTKNPLASVIFYVEVSPFISTDQLSEEILSSDPDNIDGIEWSQQKNSASMYQ